ncbi:MAG: hypothetical protein ACTHKV_05320 [Flavipsychrobacter sp.]
MFALKDGVVEFRKTRTKTLISVKEFSATAEA